MASSSADDENKVAQDLLLAMKDYTPTVRPARDSVHPSRGCPTLHSSNARLPTLAELA